MRIDHTAFFNGYRSAYGKLTQGVVSGLELLGRNMEADPDLKNLQWAAYMLATVKHECADTWQPILERGSRAYFDNGYSRSEDMNRQPPVLAHRAGLERLLTRCGPCERRPPRGALLRPCGVGGSGGASPTTTMHSAKSLGMSPFALTASSR